jgi:hypothetical protein
MVFGPTTGVVREDLAVSLVGDDSGAGLVTESAVSAAHRQGEPEIDQRLLHFGDRRSCLGACLRRREQIAS